MNWLRQVGWLVLIPWAAFWIWFAVASGLGEVAHSGLGALAAHGIQAVMILATVILAWRWEVLGGLVFVALAGLGQWLFHPDLRLALILTIPPAIGGALLIAQGCLKSSHIGSKPILKH